MKYSIFILLLIFFLCGCSSLLPDKAKFCDVQQYLCQNSTPVKVLFIGNGHTSYNNLPKLFAEISCSKGIKIQYDSITPDSAKLIEHAKNQITLKKALKNPRNNT